MRRILNAIHSLPEDVRKLLAGFLIVMIGFGFFGIWGSFMSSRLVSLGPPPASSSVEKAVPSSATARLEPRGGPPSPAQGLAETLSGLDKLVRRGRSNEREEPDSGARPHTYNISVGVRAFFAAIGEGVAETIEFLYLKLSRYVPPNL